MIDIKRYNNDDCNTWNDFVNHSRNGSLLFLRNYMDYHSNRFQDHSLLFFDAHNRLVAILPANEKDGELYSHQGLTYGGLVLPMRTRTADVLEIFHTTINYLKDRGFSAWHYKQIPTCYHLCPTEEDEYALWRCGATIESCLISTTIPLNGFNAHPEIERRRKRGMARALNSRYKITESTSFEIFWPIMENNLNSRYGIKPVHTLEEMKLLHSRFPNHIKLFLAQKGERTEAGCIVYMTNSACAHVQYGHATPQGKEDGALDLLYITLIEDFRNMGLRYMDFGNSNEQGGRYLNENLIAQKEGFGGRGIAYKQYNINIK